VTWQTSDAIKTGADAVNRLRVVASGGKATMYINDQELTTITGQPPDGGGFIGVESSTWEKTPHVWEFSNLVIKKPAH
jgi:hypothetical protein